MNTCLIAVSFFITVLITLLLVKRSYYIDNFRKNLSVGIMVHFFLGEDRLPGEIIFISDTMVRVKFNTQVYEVPNNLIYP